MHIDESTLRWLIGGVFAMFAALLAASGSLLVATLRAGRLSRDAEQALTDVAALVVAVFGDTRATPPVTGIKLDLEQLKSDASTREQILRAFCKAFRLPANSDEHEIIAAVHAELARRTADSLGEGTVTGKWRALGWHDQGDPFANPPGRPNAVKCAEVGTSLGRALPLFEPEDPPSRERRGR